MTAYGYDEEGNATQWLHDSFDDLDDDDFFDYGDFDDYDDDYDSDFDDEEDMIHGLGWGGEIIFH
jgi:hypothetical protein